MNFYTSDHHFNHKNIIKYCNRIFLSVEEMNYFMIQRWNEVVSKDDTVYHLGDFSFSSTVEDIALFVKKLNGKIILIRGNHDRKSRASFLRAGFSEMYKKTAMIKDGRTNVILSHKPLDVWEGKGDGFIHLHGHCHGNEIPFIRDRYDVGVDCWNYYPMSLEKIISK